MVFIKLKSPTAKTVLMRFVCPKNFYLKFTNELHSNSNHFTLSFTVTSLEWTLALDKLLNEIKILISKDAELAIPRTTFLYYRWRLLTVLGAMFFQPNSNNNCRIFIAGIQLPYFDNSRTKTLYF